MFKKVVLLFIYFSSIFCGFSSYYGDLKIFVDESGRTTISGLTDYGGLIISDSQKFTSKDEEFWIFNLSVDEVFSSFVFELNLPNGAQTNYIKTTPNFRIAQGNNGNLQIIGLGENRKLNILVQYSISDSMGQSSFYFWSYFLLGFVILCIFGFVVFKKIKKAKVVKEVVSTIENEVKEIIGVDYSKLNLNERQLKIISLLEKFEKISQKDLEIELNIPKSSVSRNLQALSAKNIVKIEKVGITNFVSLLK